MEKPDKTFEKLTSEYYREVRNKSLALVDRYTRMRNNAAIMVAGIGCSMSANSMPISFQVVASTVASIVLGVGLLKKRDNLIFEVDDVLKPYSMTPTQPRQLTTEKETFISAAMPVGSVLPSLLIGTMLSHHDTATPEEIAFLAVTSLVFVGPSVIVDAALKSQVKGWLS